jgi:hypothetical protein
VAETHFRNHIEEALADPLARFGGVGDYTDSLSPSNRKLLEKAFIDGTLYDTPEAMIQSAGNEYANRFVELVSGTEGKWDWMLQGHHKLDYKVPHKDGTHTVRTTDHDIADALGVPYLGQTGTKIPQALISYRLGSPRRGVKRPVLRVYAAHGQKGGDSWANPLSQLDKMTRTFNAHIYIIAHHHRLVGGRTVKLNEEVEATTRLRATDSVIVSAGSFMRSYMPDVVTYAEDGMLSPLAIGAPMIAIRSHGDGTFKMRTTT